MKATLSILIASICWGCISLFVKALTAVGFSFMQVALFRISTAAVIFLLFSLFKDRKLLRIRAKDIWIFLGTGFGSIVLMNLTYFYTITNGQASIASVLLYTSPIFIMILSAIVFQEKITKKKILALVLTFIGSLMVSGFLGSGYRLPINVLLVGLASGLSYALYTIFSKFAQDKGYEPLTITTYTFLVACLCSMLLTDIKTVPALFKANPSAILYASGIGIASTAIPYFLYTWGLQRMDAAKAGILATLEMVVGAVLGMVVYKEPHNTIKVLGTVLVAASIVVMNGQEKRAQNTRFKK